MEASLCSLETRDGALSSAHCLASALSKHVYITNILPLLYALSNMSNALHVYFVDTAGFPVVNVKGEFVANLSFEMLSNFLQF